VVASDATACRLVQRGGGKTRRRAVTGQRRGSGGRP
jgi:hypothetical protein